MADILKRFEEHDRKFNEILSIIKEYDRKFNEILDTLKRHERKLEEHDRKFDEIINTLQQHGDTLRLHTGILEQHSRILEQHSRILEEHSKKLEENSRILEQHSRILEEHSKKLDILPDLKRNVEGIERTISGVSRTLEEDARIIMQNLLRLDGINITPGKYTGCIDGEDVEIDVYGENEEYCLIGEVSLHIDADKVGQLLRNWKLFKKGAGKSIEGKKIILALLGHMIDSEAKKFAKAKEIWLLTPAKEIVPLSKAKIPYRERSTGEENTAPGTDARDETGDKIDA